MPRPSVKVEGDELIIRPWLRRKRIELASVMRIEGEKLDTLTYEENVLLLQLDNGETIWLGELDKGFAMAEAKLRTSFTPFDPGWMAILEANPAFIRYPIWDRAAAGHLYTP